MPKLAFVCVGEWMIELDDDARVFVRQLGGPIFHFGHPTNAEVPTVSAWRARLPPARRAAMVASFEEARSAKDAEYWLVPEERGSVLTLGEARLMVTYRSLATNPALDRVVAELGAIAAALRGCPAMERMENPERDQWSGVPAGQRRVGADAPEPDPSAAPLAQAAVDRFYAERLDAVLAAVASKERPRPASAAAEPPAPLEDASHTFMCRATKAPAGTISLTLTPTLGGGRLALSGFPRGGDVSILVKERDLRDVHRQLVRGDAHALWGHDETLAPFYCSQCKGSYADAQWNIYETSPTRVEGMCPAGHRRRMRAR